MGNFLVCSQSLIAKLNQLLQKLDLTTDPAGNCDLSKGNKRSGRNLLCEVSQQDGCQMFNYVEIIRQFDSTADS